MAVKSRVMGVFPPCLPGVLFWGSAFASWKQERGEQWPRAHFSLILISVSWLLPPLLYVLSVCAEVSWSFTLVTLLQEKLTSLSWLQFENPQEGGWAVGTWL
jgi:hypothetical protein